MIVRNTKGWNSFQQMPQPNCGGSRAFVAEPAMERDLLNPIDAPVVIGPISIDLGVTAGVVGQSARLPRSSFRSCSS